MNSGAINSSAMDIGAINNAPVSTRLDEILAHKRQEVAQLKAGPGYARLEQLALQAPRPLDFTAGLRARADRAAGRAALIAEIKRASPSKGPLAPGLDAGSMATLYRENGAAAISVLTDQHFFRGSLDDLRQVAALQPRLPVLRKDFIIDACQVLEARATGADAVLLIAACLARSVLVGLHALATGLGMAALVEVHQRDELERVLECCAPVLPHAQLLVGINNRDLRTFQVRLETSLELLPLLPAGVCAVAESGIHTPADVVRLAQAGATAVLVGEALVTAGDTPAQVRRLAQVEAIQ